jgi:hypothetical protein
MRVATKVGTDEDTATAVLEADSADTTLAAAERDARNSDILGSVTKSSKIIVYLVFKHSKMSINIITF